MVEVLTKEKQSLQKELEAAKKSGGSKDDPLKSKSLHDRLEEEVKTLRK